MADPDVIRGIERVTGETFNAETGQWVRGQSQPAIDGSVAELQLNGDGTITAEIRIPGNQRDGHD
jgi:hypothetical protein